MNAVKLELMRQTIDEWIKEGIIKNPFSKGSKKTGLLDVPTWPSRAARGGARH